jgi:hypothetical protein
LKTHVDRYPGLLSVAVDRQMSLPSFENDDQSVSRGR